MAGLRFRLSWCVHSARTGVVGVHSILTMSELRAHIASLNEWAGSSTVLRELARDEDTVTFRVYAGAAKGVVNVSLHERSSYPRTGGLAFADLEHCESHFFAVCGIIQRLRVSTVGFGAWVSSWVCWRSCGVPRSRRARQAQTGPAAEVEISARVAIIVDSI